MLGGLDAALVELYGGNLLSKFVKGEARISLITVLIRKMRSLGPLRLGDTRGGVAGGRSRDNVAGGHARANKDDVAGGHTRADKMM